MIRSSDSRKGLLIACPLPPPYSGPEVLARDITESLLSEKYRVVRFISWPEKMNNEKGKWSLLNVYMMCIDTLKCLKCLLLNRVDFVYTSLTQNLTGFLRFSIFIILSKYFKKKVVAVCLGNGFDFFFNNIKIPFLKRYIKYVLLQIDKIVVHSNFLMSQYSNCVEDEKIINLPLGLNTKRFPVVSEHHLKNKMNLEGPFKILFVGHISKAKGAYDIFEIANDVSQALNGAVRFDMIGSEINIERNIVYIKKIDDFCSAKDFLRHKRISQIVCLHGTVDNDVLYDYYLGADLFLFPSYSEAVPVVILEAMAAGLPIVATNVGGIPETVENERGGYLIQAGNKNNLYEAVVSLAYDKELRYKMGLHNRQTILNINNMDRYANDLCVLYDSL